MSSRKRNMIRKANELIDYGYTPTFRQLMVSYRFWMNVKKGKIIRILNKQQY